MQLDLEPVVLHCFPGQIDRLGQAHTGLVERQTAAGHVSWLHREVDLEGEVTRVETPTMRGQDALGTRLCTNRVVLEREVRPREGASVLDLGRKQVVVERVGRDMEEP